MRAQQDILNFLARPSFTEGMARVLDIGGVIHQDNDGATTGDSDYRAILNDWIVTGNDLGSSIEFYGRRIGKSSAP